ncbi:MAG TPA: very short patch repair endonuclease [Solirubrobacterales bacterium]|nr:very short patch repair endonuclease [Solirubrobacterales bacterium]
MKNVSSERPLPVSAAKSAEMSRLGQRDTKPELAIRSELHRRGFRFRVDRAPIKGLRSRADIVFGPARIAVYVDGCFWHSCPEHGTKPRSNADWWEQKLSRNRERDLETDRVLKSHGWGVVRIWEHEDPVSAADRIADLLRQREAGSHG